MKQLVLINHSWKMGKGTFFPKKREVEENSRERLPRESNLCLLLVFLFINLSNITIQGKYNSNKFQ